MARFQRNQREALRHRGLAHGAAVPGRARLQTAQELAGATGAPLVAGAAGPDGVRSTCALNGASSPSRLQRQGELAATAGRDVAGILLRPEAGDNGIAVRVVVDGVDPGVVEEARRGPLLLRHEAGEEQDLPSLLQGQTCLQAGFRHRTGLNDERRQG